MRALNLDQIPLFASLPQSELARLACTFEAVELVSKTILVREGELGDRFYIILEGEVEIIKALGTAEERLLSHRGPGDYIGEMSLIGTHGLRTASVRTRTAVRLLSMTHSDFDALLHRCPVIAYEMARVLSTCLRDSNDSTIHDLQEKNRQLAKAYQELQSAQLQIIEKEKLEHELQVARVIQQSILPRCLPHLPGFGFGVRMVPARAVGGDFFDFIPLTANTLGIAVGDVSDKGVPAAIFMAMTRSLMRSEARRAASPRAALLGVNHQLLEMNDAGMFVTVLYGVLDQITGRFDYVRAGHTLPTLCAPDGTVLQPPSAPGQPLGVFPEPALDEQTLMLAPGSTLVLYTDGMTDAIDQQGNPFGLERLHTTVCTHCSTPPQMLCDRLMQNAMTYQDTTTSQLDDMTVVVVRTSTV
jgi:sigma-B regulation protein RsbU (phosphoserine phosphatase)